MRTEVNERRRATQAVKRLASKIAKREGKKSQARVGDIREVIKLMAVIDNEMAAADVDHGNHPIQVLCDYANTMRPVKKMSQR